MFVDAQGVGEGGTWAVEEDVIGGEECAWYL